MIKHPVNMALHVRSNKKENFRPIDLSVFTILSERAIHLLENGIKYNRAWCISVAIIISLEENKVLKKYNNTNS